MKLNILCASALLLGTTALAVPAFAADTGNNTPATSDQANDNASSSSATNQNQPAMANGSQAGMQASPDTSAASNANNTMPDNNTQVAMNSTGTASDVSSVTDNQHKYSKAKKSSEDRSEDQTTKQLNQQEAGLNGGSGNAAAQ
jgi:hypothetical protein